MMSEDAKKRKAQACRDKGNHLFRGGDLRGARAEYDEAVKTASNDSTLRSNRSACLAALQEWGAAACDARSCIRLDPTAEMGYIRLARALRGSSDLAEAVTQLRGEPRPLGGLTQPLLFGPCLSQKRGVHNSIEGWVRSRDCRDDGEQEAARGVSAS